MNAHCLRVAAACFALASGLAAGPALVGTAMAQQAAIIDPNAAKGDLSPHDAAMAASRKGDYISALAFANKAAAAGQPLDAEQLDFISGKAAKQQAALDEADKLKAKQQEAAGTAQAILDRQQKEYAAREKKVSASCTSNSGGPGAIGTFTSAAGAAASSGGQSGMGAKVTGADDIKKCPG